MSEIKFLYAQFAILLSNFLAVTFFAIGLLIQSLGSYSGNFGMMFYVIGWINLMLGYRIIDKIERRLI